MYAQQCISIERMDAQCNNNMSIINAHQCTTIFTGILDIHFPMNTGALAMPSAPVFMGTMNIQYTSIHRRVIAQCIISCVKNECPVLQYL